MIGGGAVPAPCAGSTARAGAPSASLRCLLRLRGRPRPRRRALALGQLPRSPRGLDLAPLPRERRDQLHVPLDRGRLQLFRLGGRALVGRLLAAGPGEPPRARRSQRVQLRLLLPSGAAGLGHVSLEAPRRQAARARQGRQRRARVRLGRAGRPRRRVLRRLALPDGRVLRPAVPGRPTADCLFKDVMRDGGSLLKVSTVNGTTVAVAAPVARRLPKKEEEEEEEDGGGDEAEGSEKPPTTPRGQRQERRKGPFRAASSPSSTPRAPPGRAGPDGSSCSRPGTGARRRRRVRSELRRGRLLAQEQVRCPSAAAASGSKKKRTESEDEAEADAEVLSTTVSPFDVTPKLRTPPSGAFIAWSDEQQRRRCSSRRRRRLGRSARTGARLPAAAAKAA